jgi:RimJ/RimL family protein N-acetyltransferase
MSNTQLFYSLREPATAGPAAGADLSPDYRADCWRPRWPALKPPVVPAVPFAVWGLFHHLRFFANRDYAIQLITFQGELVHRSCAFPPYFRFPFMARNDIQIGDTWTAEAHRGKGLAVEAMNLIATTLAQPGRTFWYLCDEDNPASARVAVKAGFSLAGRGVRTKRMGLRLLGAFHLTQPAN